MNRFLSYAFLLPPLLAAAACGSVAANTDKPGTLAIVAGSVTNSAFLAVDGSGFRVAAVWDRSGQATGDGGYASDRLTTQDVEVSPEFPARFELRLTELPPDLQPFAELFGSKGSVDLRGIGGHVIAYEDLNHDGKLDLVSASDGAFVDRVLGMANLPLLYLEGTMPSDPSLLENARDADGNLPALGFNLFETFCVSGKAPPRGRSCDTAFNWVPVTTPVSIALTGEPKLENLMCREYPSGTTSENTIPHPPGDFPKSFPTAADPSVKCQPDGRSYTSTTDRTETPPGICQPSTEYHNQDTYVLAAGAGAPTGWPCTVH